MSVGVLALQGAFIEHCHCLEKLGEEYKLLRNAESITDDIDRIILPGGESTVQKKLLKENGMFDKLKAMIDNDTPVLGTCAGLILLSEECENDNESGFATLPVVVKRNAFGRQTGSFSDVDNIGDIKNFPMRFIRAPYITKILNNDVDTLCEEDNKIFAVRYKKQLALSFHPELTDDLRIHEYFLNM